MNMFSRMRVSQKILLLVTWLALGYAALAGAYYWQTQQEVKVRETAHLYRLFDTYLQQARGHLQDFIANSFLAAAPEELSVNQHAFSRALSQAKSLLKKEPTLANPQNLLSTFEALTAEPSASVQLAPAQPQYVEEKIRSQFTVVDTIIKTRAKPQELAALGKLHLLHEAFLTDRQEVNRTSVQAYVGDVQALLDDNQRSDVGMTLLRTALADYLASFNQVVAPVRVAGFDDKKYQPLLQQITQVQRTMDNQLSQYVAGMDGQIEHVRKLFIALIFVVVLGAALGVYLIYKSIIQPLVHMQDVMQSVNKGNSNARATIVRQDELGDLAGAFNQLLDERFEFLQEQLAENDTLNNSIISLIKAVGLIAQKDLTVHVPVSADITGTISDAINLLTAETAKTLWQVKDISARVNELADALQKQSRLVVQVAEDERKQVIATGKAMELSAKTMGDIAAKAQDADKFAVMAIDNTQSAWETVSRSVTGILSIRETISETEKRIKRLGDRSQEISGIVNLINTIAERTHILALNASMHAASAGEAGKGFAVVADEVQRLAENAREATAEISSMVNNIRIETADAVATMNKLIAQVAEGTRLAESAGSKMEDTLAVTKRLVEYVQLIAHSSAQQALLSNRVRDRATIIRSFTEKTGLQLTQQKHHTDSLKVFCETLLERVNSFVLPEPLKEPIKIPPAVQRKLPERESA